MNTLQTRDFPDWIGPMLVKELRQGLKARAFELTFITLQVILALVVGYHALLYARHGAKFNAEGLNGTFWFIVGLQLLAVNPLRALSGLTNERKANTLELIFMTGLSSWRITWGKWASLFFQAILFVLAVLPYGVLRYFFGGVNLSEDLTMLGSFLLASGVLSALALAMSGMPAFMRVGAIIAFCFFGLGFFQMMLMRAIMGGSGGGMFSGLSMSSDSAWPLLIFNAALICVSALAIGAWSIAPVAENHALRQRSLVLAAWLPIPLMKLLGVTDGLIAAQAVFFICLGLAVSWFHFSIQPPAMRVHLEPFTRRGQLAQLAGFVFQPGWPGAVLFLVVVEALFAGTVLSIMNSSGNDFPEVTAIAVMAGAALMTPPLVWRLFRIPSKAALILQSLFLGLCGGLFALVETLGDGSFREAYWAAFLPPFGFFAMFDGGFGRGGAMMWLVVALVTFSIIAFMLLLLARSYWGKMSAHGRDIRNTPKRVPMPLEVTA